MKKNPHKVKKLGGGDEGLKGALPLKSRCTMCLDCCFLLEAACETHCRSPISRLAQSDPVQDHQCRPSGSDGSTHRLCVYECVNHRTTQNQVCGVTSECPGLQLHSGPAALSSSLPQSPPSPWPPSSGSWTHTAAWEHTRCHDAHMLILKLKKDLHRKEEECSKRWVVADLFSMIL